MTLDVSDIAAYTAGESAKSIAERVGVTPRTVLAILQREGIKTRSMSEAITLTNPTPRLRAARAAIGEDEFSKRMSAGMRGIPLDEWTSFAKHEDERVRSTKAWSEWRHSVFVRDGFACRLCTTATMRLEPHHIRRRCDRPDLTFDVANGITLCSSCHRAVTGSEREWEDIFDQAVQSA